MRSLYTQLISLCHLHLGLDPLHGAAAHAMLGGDLQIPLPPSASAARIACSFFRSIAGRPSRLPCALARASPALTRWRIMLPLELGKGAGDLKQQLPGRCGRVQALLIEIQIHQNDHVKMTERLKTIRIDRYTGEIIGA